MPCPPVGATLPRKLSGCLVAGQSLHFRSQQEHGLLPFPITFSGDLKQLSVSGIWQPLERVESVVKLKGVLFSART